MSDKPSLTSAIQGEWYDATKIKSFRNCPRKYYYRHVLGLVPVGSLSPDLTFGQGIHAALEYMYKGGDTVTRVPCPHGPCEFCNPNEGMIRAHYAEFMKQFPASSQDGKNTVFVGLSLLSHYLSKWNRETFGEILSVEQPFAIPFGKAVHGVDIYWVGKMDLTVRDSMGIAPVDHKTASRFGEFFEKGFKIDVQITGYIWATPRLFDEECNHAVINALRKSVRPSEEDLVRKITQRIPEEIESWEREVLHTISEIHACSETGVWPQNGDSCFNYWRECEYRCLCTTGSAGREGLIRGNYTTEKWEPV